MKESIGILKSEHRSISAVLLGLKHLAEMAQDASVKPDFAVFRSMLRYIDEYPERLHHPKEDEHLFARLVRRFPGARKLIDGLKEEHLQGAKLIRELERRLMLFEEGWPQGAAEFLGSVNAYADFHWKHMRKEETELVPLAEKHLTVDDWRAIDRAFGANEDPIAQIEERDFQRLFSRIASLAPAPVGLGDPWKKVVN
ncbi:MAG TPA: hemerythrin domain-containing protein [Burkholderiales bacterium]|jgi:hemerythrin-like domain-containing protein